MINMIRKHRLISKYDKQRFKQEHPNRPQQIGLVLRIREYT